MPVAMQDPIAAAPPAPTQSTPEPEPFAFRQESLDTTADVADLLVQMPAWSARGLLYIVLLFAATAFVWARLSRVDMVVSSRGAVIPEGYVRQVQASTDGIVQYIRVREGATIRQGQMLFHLDTRELRGKAASLRAELATSEEQLRQQLVIMGPASETLERQNRISRLKEELAAAELAISKATITSPIDGTVTALDVRHAGEIIRAGQQLVAIAPSGARLIVEAQVPNARIGFVEQGLPVKIKLDAFPFQEYGSMSGTVMDVSPDAWTKGQQGSFYRVLIAPSQATMVNCGRILKLRPGLTLTAEIVTERKTVLDLLLEPIRKLRAQVVNLG